MPPPIVVMAGELPVKMLLLTVDVPMLCKAAAVAGGVAGEGAGHSPSASRCVVEIPPPSMAELPEKTLLLTVNVPELSRPPPFRCRHCLQ